MSTAEILIASVLKSVGKREFLKTVNTMFNRKEKLATQRVPRVVPDEEMCVARKKGDPTGIKVGKHMLYHPVRCGRRCLAGKKLCIVHNKVASQKGQLPLGIYSDPLTDDVKNIFGEL